MLRTIRTSWCLQTGRACLCLLHCDALHCCLGVAQVVCNSGRNLSQLFPLYSPRIAAVLSYVCAFFGLRLPNTSVFCWLAIPFGHLGLSGAVSVASHVATQAAWHMRQISTMPTVAPCSPRKPTEAKFTMHNCEALVVNVVCGVCAVLSLTNASVTNVGVVYGEGGGELVEGWRSFIRGCGSSS